MKLSPSVRGIAALSWTITVFADRIAACIASTAVPSEQYPCSSGIETLQSTTSSGSRPASNSPMAKSTLAHCPQCVPAGIT